MLPDWMNILILLLLLQAAGNRAQSGDRDSDSEPGLSCSSHVSVVANNLTCQLLGRRGDEDDEDGDRDAIDEMIVCQVRHQKHRMQEKCVQAHGDTVSGLCPVAVANVTVHRRGGGRLSATVLLHKIVKPKSPWIVQVTMDPLESRAVIHFQIPYSKDYLNLNTQTFQLNLWTDGSNITQNVSSKNFLQMDMQHLRQDSEYRVRVRSVPVGVLQGTWSSWSPSFSFHTPPGEDGGRPAADSPDLLLLTSSLSPDETERPVFGLVLTLVSALVVLCGILVVWKTGIFSFLWPSIPHPKQALVQICKPNKGLLLDLHHEVFSSLRVLPQAEEAEPHRRPSGSGSESGSGSGSRSSHSTASSANTEELEVSALLSCSDGEDSSVPSGVPSPVDVPRREDEFQNLLARRSGPGPEEAYVTMSSFYQSQQHSATSWTTSIPSVLQI